MRYSPFFVLILSLLTIGCSLPEKKLSQLSLVPNYSETSDSLFIDFQNTVACPLRVSFTFQKDKQKLAQAVTLEGFGKGKMNFRKKDILLKDVIEHGKFTLKIGDPRSTIVDSSARYIYPFPKGKSYTVIQGYNGSFSHQNNYSRYAIDLNLADGDTVCAARKGVVVGVIEGYDVGGNWEKYRPYANFITVYHQDGTMAQYVHLKLNGALVELGDSVAVGTPIALAGSTGYTSSPHLHFNVIVPTADHAKSIPIKFLQIDGNAITQGYTLFH